MFEATDMRLTCHRAGRRLRHVSLPRPLRRERRSPASPSACSVETPERLEDRASHRHQRTPRHAAAAARPGRRDAHRRPRRPPIADAVVCSRDGKIECAGTRASADPRRTSSRDARGMWITPGLVDAHVHFSQTGWADGRPDALDLRDRIRTKRRSRTCARIPSASPARSLCSGVTGVFDVGGYPWTRELARARRARHRRAARLRRGPAALDARSLAQPARRAAVHLSERRGVGARRRALSRRAMADGDQGLVPRTARTSRASSTAVRAAGEEAQRGGCR